MTLLQIVQEASRTGEYPRLNKRAAKNVLMAIAEWIDMSSGSGDWAEVAKEIRQEARIG